MLLLHCNFTLPTTKCETKPSQKTKIHPSSGPQHVSYSTNHSLTHSHAHTHTHTFTHFVIHPTELRSCWCRRKSLQRYYDKLGKKSSPESTANYNMKREQSQLAYMQHDAPRVRKRGREAEREREQVYTVHTITRQLEAAREVCHRSTERCSKTFEHVE